MGIAIAVLVVAVVLLAIALVWLWMRQRQRSRGLREQFGSEYDQTVEQAGSRRQAERELDARRERVSDLHIVELSEEESKTFASKWAEVQQHFVDKPSEAISEADNLVTRVMDRRGYPMSDFDQRAADISVDHPDVVSEYRDARAIAERNANGGASTEELRQAMLHYRSLFDELLGKRAA